MSRKTAYRVEFFGRVQGVGFRYYCVKIARSYAMNGYVRNKSEGSVEIVCEGTQEQVDEFIAKCEEGNGFSVVTEKKIETVNLEGYYGFTVKT